jgi:hypothetical protein
MTFYASPPDSGYSVDNLAPDPPLGLAGEQSFLPAGLDISWAPNTEVDLDCYHVYRGTEEVFTPGIGNLIASSCDTAFFDDTWQWDSGYWYKVSALDIHGNESGYAALGPGAVTGEEPSPMPDATYLAQNYPNPFNPVTEIAFGIKTPDVVTLRIYDAGGRLVRILLDKKLAAGHYRENWDGLSGSGHRVASGVYFYKLHAGDFVQTKKMVLLR